MKTKFFASKKVFLIIVFSAFLLTACGKDTLYQDLTERDANEILVVLYKNHIDASKLRVEKAQEVSYNVEVPHDEIQKARRILVDNNLPRSKQLGFSGICKEKGLIPTPEEEKCRKLLALKGEIINSLERVPGVVDADVVLNIPEVSEFSTETQSSKKPTASAVLRVRKNAAGEEVTESRIQRFISNSVENLDPRDVSVIISYLESPEEVLQGGPSSVVINQGGAPSAVKLATLAGLTLTLESVKRFKIYAVVMLILLIGVSAALILNVIKLTKLRQELKVSKVQGGVAQLQAGSSPPLLEEGSKPGDPAVNSEEKARRPGSL
jgi:type III secretion protein J